jgi:hypothetical protein
MPSADVRRATVAALLIAAGIVLCGLYRVLSGTEHHAFSADALPPKSVHVTAGTTYHLAVHGGVDALIKRGAVLSAPQCDWSVGDNAPDALTVSAYDANTKATDAVGTFIAPFTGNLRITCAGWGPIFVDDADNSSSDVAGWMLFFGVIALTLGGALAVAAWRASSEARAAAWSDGAAGEGDQIERGADIELVRVGDIEVGSPDGGDVGEEFRGPFLGRHR